MLRCFRSGNPPQAIFSGHLLPFSQLLIIIALLLVPFEALAAPTTGSKRVMVLHSFGRDFKPWSAYATAIRTELEQRSPWPLEIIDLSLMTARGWDENPEVP